MAKQTGKRKNSKTTKAKKGTPENPKRLDFGHTMLDVSADEHYVGFIIERQNRKNGPWIFEDVLESKSKAEGGLDAYIKSAIGDQEWEWRRRHGIVQGKSVQRIVFDEKTKPAEFEKMIVDARARYQRTVDASEGKNIKPFKPNKYPRFRIVQRTIVTTVTDETIAERGPQDGLDTPAPAKSEEA